MTERQANYAPIYILAAAAIGAVIGTLFGAIFDPVIPAGPRTLAVLSALAAVGVEYAARRYLANMIPTVFSHHVATASPALLFVAGVIALASGLATHDLGLKWNVMDGAVLGGFSGLFAGLMAAALVILREDERGAAAAKAKQGGA
ncbi:hypothetical protein [Devosia sp. CN2-171]|uniref:hypothetical protein n=1 Tax=Devosia sp. CN2-171 TaxID=3400909 RepID=UPI003BF82A79